MDNIDAKHVEELRRRLEEHLRDKDFTFNPDHGIVESILTSLTARFQKNGADYCPCRRVTGDADQDAKIVCPCAYHMDEIRDQGRCHCHLFVKK